MAAKKALTDEELLAQFDDITAQDTTTDSSKSSDSKALETPQSPAGTDDALAELENLAKPTSRSHTPKVNVASGQSLKAETVTTTASESARTSEEKSRGLSSTTKLATGSHVAHVDSKKEPLNKNTQNKSSKEPGSDSHAKENAGGGWWGGIFATASAAVKQAEAAVKEIQNTEEAQRLAEQVKGNVGALRDLGRHCMIVVLA